MLEPLCKHIVCRSSICDTANKDVNPGFTNVQCETSAYEYPGLTANPGYICAG